MNAVAAFENRRDALRAQLEQAQDERQAVSACTMALEQIACELAQDEQDERARQRQQAVMAVARRAPLFMRSARAQGRLVIAPAQGEGEKSPGEKARFGARALGALVLAALAIYEAIDGKTVFALLQLVGALLLALGGGRRSAQEAGTAQAEGVLRFDAQDMLREVGEICQAADICAGDLAIIEQGAGTAHLSGTADDAMLDLLASMMEAKASGRDELAMRSLSQAEQYLHALGVEPVFYDAERAAMFDILPTMGETRTVRPALVSEGKILRRGVAALRMERSVSA